MRISLDQLVEDINNSSVTEVTLAIMQDGEFVYKTVAYEKLRLQQGNDGSIPLGDYETQESISITIEYLIEKEDNQQEEGKACYYIIRDDCPVLQVCLFFD